MNKLTIRLYYKLLPLFDTEDLTTDDLPYKEESLSFPGDILTKDMTIYLQGYTNGSPQYFSDAIDKLSQDNYLLNRILKDHIGIPKEKINTLKDFYLQHPDYSVE